MQKDTIIQALENSIRRMNKSLSMMELTDIARLDQTLRQLSAEQLGFIRSTLNSTTVNGQVPTHQLELLKYFVKSWWKHSLPAKLVIIDRLIEIADGVRWPEDNALRHVVTGKYLSREQIKRKLTDYQNG